MHYTVQSYDFHSKKLLEDLGEYFTQGRAEYIAKKESMVNGTGVLVILTCKDTRKVTAYRRGRVFQPQRLKDWLPEEQTQLVLEL